MFPRFTLRTILAVTTMLAAFFVLVGTGTRGQSWAWGAAIGIASVAVSVLVQAALYLIVRCFAQLSTASAARASTPPMPTEREAAS